MHAPLTSTEYTHHEIPMTGSKLNWLRAAVLGANDGIVSVSSIVLGVAGASNSPRFVLTAGVAGLVAGALSMAVGEYVSVSTQRDTERAIIERERIALAAHPEQELRELASIYEQKGLSPKTAQTVAEELSARDPFAAHVDAEHGIDPNDLANPGHAAYASALAFFSGAVIPLLAITLPPLRMRIPITFVSVIAALIVTGQLSAWAGGADKTRATFRVVLGGILAMVITFCIGKIFGVVGI